MPPQEEDDGEADVIEVEDTTTGLEPPPSDPPPRAEAGAGAVEEATHLSRREQLLERLAFLRPETVSLKT